ncbi:MAG: hypothetical protein ABIW85_09940 [Variovorax sp.]
MTSTPTTPQANPNEEPEITQEESVPSDGKDEEGEKMMREVRNPKLKPEAGDPTAQKTPPNPGA